MVAAAVRTSAGAEARRRSGDLCGLAAGPRRLRPAVGEGRPCEVGRPEPGEELITFRKTGLRDERAGLLGTPEDALGPAG